MSKIISIHSFRGGTGKSNITANTATQLALKGHKVGVVDTDIQSPGIHIIFQLDPEKVKKTLNDFLKGNCDVDEIAYEVTPKEVASAGGSIHLIPSSLNAQDITLILRDGYDVGVLGTGYKKLCEMLTLDYLLIDTHPGLNEETLLSITLSNSLILIMRPDQQDFQGTAVTLDVARKLEVPNIALVMNKTLPSHSPDEYKKQIKKLYDIDLVAILPLTEEMVELGSRNVFSLEYPDHPLTDLFASIAAHV